MNKYKLLLIVIPLIIILASCGGGSENTTTTSAEKINGITVPPEPDAKTNNSTIAGIDINNNGVRDDIERTIASTSSSASEFNANIEITKEYQKILTSKIISSSEINKIQKLIACIATKNNSIKIDSELKLIIANTDERKSEFRKKLSSAGGTSIAIGECK